MRFRENPNHGKLYEDHELCIGDDVILVNLKDYKDLGWQLHKDNNEIVAKIFHDKLPIREFDNSFYQNRGTDVIYICDALGVYWHIDMSD